MDAKRQLPHAQHVGFVSLQIGGVPLASALKDGLAHDAVWILVCLS